MYRESSGVCAEKQKAKLLGHEDCKKASYIVAPKYNKSLLFLLLMGNCAVYPVAPSASNLWKV